MTAARGRRTRYRRASTLAFVLAMTASVNLSWGATADERANPALRSTPAAPKTSRPYWVELSAAQREALAPLAGEWEGLDGQHKKKWVEIAGRYPKMKPEEQQHTQERMREWATLTPEQRRVARDSFARVQAMTPEKRAEMLRKYRELPDEKKEALAVEGQATKALVTTKAAIRHSVRRSQIREGAKASNPAVAVQKGVAAQTAANAPSASVAQPIAPAPVSASQQPVPLSAPSASPASTTNADKPPVPDGGAARP